MKLFSHVWAFLTRQEVVYLVDFDGDITRTFARRTATRMLAERHWPLWIHTVILNEDGTIGNRSYVKSWFK